MAVNSFFHTNNLQSLKSERNLYSNLIKEAIQIHGAAGISQWTPLADMYTDMRHLRFADGPDEVHHMVVGRAELQKYDLW